MSESKVKITKAEQVIIDALPEGLRAGVTAEILSKKTKAEAVREVNRNEFSVKLNEKGNLVIRGTGNRYPIGMRTDTWEFLKRNMSAIDTVAATAKKA